MTEWEKHIGMLPGHMRASLMLYIQAGIPPGGFLTAVLANDLQLASVKADSINAMVLSQWGLYMMWYMPPGSHGDYRAVERWVGHRGLAGIDDALTPQEPDNAADTF